MNGIAQKHGCVYRPLSSNTAPTEPSRGRRIDQPRKVMLLFTKAMASPIDR
jgi:hypothetical protein